jgi:HEAT repeat protein
MGIFNIFTPDILKMRDAGDVRGLAKALGDSNPDIARKAAAALVGLPSSGAVIPLIRSLSSPDKDIRRLSAAALGATGDPRALPVVLEATEDEDLGVRLEAVKALVQFHDPEANSLISRFTNDSNLDIRMAAVSALGQTGDPSSIEPLLHLLVDPHYGIREVSAYALDSLGWVPVNDQDKAFYSIAKREWIGLFSLQSVAVKTLFWALKDEYYAVRQGAASTLGKLKDIRAVRPLVSALSDEESSVRMEVVSALGEIGDLRTVPILVRALDDDYIGVRMTAASVLDGMGWKPSTENDLILYLLAKERWMDIAVIGKRSMQVLAKRLNDPNYSTRDEVGKILQRLGEHAREPMLAALNNPDLDVRLRAVWLLGNIGTREAVGPIIRILSDDNPACREEAVRALGKIGDPRAIPFLNRVLGREILLAPVVIRALGQIAHPASIKALMPHLGSADREIRLHTIRALGENGDKKISGAIAHAVKDSDPEVRVAAITVISKFPSNEVYALIRAALEDVHPDVRYAALLAISTWQADDTIPLMVRRLEDGDQKICRIAAQALNRRRWQPASLQERRNYLIAMGQWRDLERLDYVNKELQKKESDLAGHITLQGSIMDPVPPLSGSPGELVDGDPTRPGGAGITGEPDSLQALIRTLGDQKEMQALRWRSAEGLGGLGDMRGVEPLIVALFDQDSELRWRAAFSLGLLHDERAIEPLATALRDDDQLTVRVRVAEALGQFKKPVVIRPLIHSLSDIHPDVRDMAIRSLGEIGTESAINAILTGLLDADEAVRERVIDTLLKLGAVAGRSLVKNLKNRNPDVKKGVLTVFMRMKPAISFHILVSELENGDWEVRQMVAAALDSLDWQPGNPFQRAIYLFAQRDWKALEAQGKAAEGILIRGTADSDPTIRRASVELLGLIGDRSTVPSLTEVMHDENQEVRLSSIKTLLKRRGGESSRLISTLKRNVK